MALVMHLVYAEKFKITTEKLEKTRTSLDCHKIQAVSNIFKPFRFLQFHILRNPVES